MSAPWDDQGVKNSHRQLARKMFWQAHDRETYQCPDCGRRAADLLRPFEVHHQNGDAMDNRNENLVGVCRPCHNIREGKKPSLKEIKNLRDSVQKNEHNSDGVFVKNDKLTPSPILKCPGCGLGWLHQRRIEVFGREREDSEQGVHATIAYGAESGGPGKPTNAAIDSSMDGNPSARRDGIRISFECEQCDRHPTLRIVQHKGQERISWEGGR